MHGKLKQWFPCYTSLGQAIVYHEHFLQWVVVDIYVYVAVVVVAMGWWRWVNVLVLVEENISSQQRN